jgi:hypothetical protein
VKSAHSLFGGHAYVQLGQGVWIGRLRYRVFVDRKRVVHPEMGSVGRSYGIEATHLTDAMDFELCTRSEDIVAHHGVSAVTRGA